MFISSVNFLLEFYDSHSNCISSINHTKLNLHEITVSLQLWHAPLLYRPYRERYFRLYARDSPFETYAASVFHCINTACQARNVVFVRPIFTCQQRRWLRRGWKVIQGSAQERWWGYVCRYKAAVHINEFYGDHFLRVSSSRS